MDKKLREFLKALIWDMTVGSGGIDDDSSEKPDAPAFDRIARAVAIHESEGLGRQLTDEEKNFIGDEWRTCVQSAKRP